MDSISKGQFNLPHGNLGKKRSSIRVEEAKTWMDRYFNLIGDKLPDKNQIHLPSWDKQKNIYERYKDDMLEKGTHYVSLILTCGNKIPTVHSLSHIF